LSAISRAFFFISARLFPNPSLPISITIQAFSISVGAQANSLVIFIEDIFGLELIASILSGN